MLFCGAFPGGRFFPARAVTEKNRPRREKLVWLAMTRGQPADALGVAAAELEMNNMNGELKPTPLPEDLRRSLYVVLERIRFAEYFDLFAPDDWLRDALEVIRCHLVGIDTTAENDVTEPQVRGEGWSL